MIERINIKLKKLFIPIIIILVAAASFPLTTYLKEYNHSKELYEGALEIYSSDDVERHSKALKLLHNIPGGLVILRNKDASLYITVDNPYRKRDDRLTYEIEEDYKVYYRSYLNKKYRGSLIAYISNYWELNFADLGGRLKPTSILLS